ncbi:TPA: hypothetical protein PL523_004464 [Cronobacter turicensis]|nr:hypothetical protein [Cronobacter turicensis]
MSKIHNPVVLINKTGNDTYSIAVTDGSDNYQDARLMACMELEIAGDNADVFSRVGYYMAAEIEALRERVAELENDEVRQRLANAEHQLYLAELAKNNLRASRKAQFKKRLIAERRNAELTDALRLVVSGYKSCLRTGYERIIELGGACDEPETMIAANPDIRQAERILAGGEA